MHWNFRFQEKEYFLLECGEIVIVHRDPRTDEPKSYRGPFSLHEDLMKLLQLFVKNANREMDVRTLCHELWPGLKRVDQRLRKDIQRLREELDDPDRALICKARGRVGAYVFSADVVEHSDFGDPTPVSGSSANPNPVPLAFFLPSSIDAKEGAELREVILLRAQDLAFRVVGCIPVASEKSSEILHELLRAVPYRKELMAWADIGHPADLVNRMEGALSFSRDGRVKAYLLTSSVRFHLVQTSDRYIEPGSLLEALLNDSLKVHRVSEGDDDTVELVRTALLDFISRDRGLS